VPQSSPRSRSNENERAAPAGPSLDGDGGSGATVVSALFLAFALVMLALLTAETKPAPSSKGWWTEPALVPGYALAVMALGAVGVLGQRLLRRRRRAAPREVPAISFPQLREALTLIEYTVYFAGYVWAVDKIGYALSTLLFAQIACWRSGLRGWRTTVFVLALSVVLVVLFRVILGVWFPTADLYELLPAALRNFAIQRL